ncbi:F-box protein: endocytic membrane traffic, recycling ReCYcling 1 [Ceratocystis pirilliformis]|uniref:F-box protein: endocytic membrane traffic, recycling ReCYcling 1 n=1 Tax=Ceratocystis pirilliformis TaxID=259994 RepID=A0ABR3ZFK9_9PEZI
MYGRKSLAAPPLGPPSFVNAMKNIDMTDSRPLLPAEITVKILNYLDIPDLMHCACASRRMWEMVYDDSRWVARLKSMGCWDEAAARRRFDQHVQRRREAAAAAARQRQAAAVRPDGSTTLFDQAVEENNLRVAQAAAAARPLGDLDGFKTLSIASGQLQPSTQAVSTEDPAQPAGNPASDPMSILNVIKNAQSIRGHAREEFGKIYGALSPFYNDLVRSKSHTDPIIFKVFRDPERQAQMLANLRAFARCDWSAGAVEREERVLAMIGIFESAVLREFEQGYEFWDVDGRMKRYATVLHLLNGGSAGRTLFVEKHPIFSDPELLAKDWLECLSKAHDDIMLLGPVHQFFQTLLSKINIQAGVIERIFPEPQSVFWMLVDRCCDELVNDYITPLFDDAHGRNIEVYLKAVSAIFEQCIVFFQSLRVPGSVSSDAPVSIKDSSGDSPDPNEKEIAEKAAALTLKKAQEMTWRLFEPHLFTYLQEELDFFTGYADAKVAAWEKNLSEQNANVESFFMSSFSNRQAAKKDFLSSFKTVVMMPVTALPSFNFSSSLKTAEPSESRSTDRTTKSDSSTGPNLTEPTSSSDAINASTMPSLPAQAPTDELAAKAALMASRLEGIKSLFSMELAIDLIHHAKVSIGRAAVFIPLGDQAGGEAREQCEAIFAALLRSLGTQHMNAGFQQAIEHLASYNPREAAASSRSRGTRPVPTSGPSATGVAPLAMFIELVNVGDLISQMIDVFYEQQLTSTNIVDKRDFLDPAAKAKKKFEQMLDENVAAILNKGIDVLMNEVEYLQATTQLPTDYNPPSESTVPAKRGTLSGVELDIGPTPTAQRIVDLVSSHTNMLVGTTDKAMLDVFNGEVGLRLFTSICKHLKRQRISTAGAIKLIADMNAYWAYIRSLKNPDLQAYFGALRELSQIYLIDGKHAKEMAMVIADTDRFGGVFRAEEVYEYAQRRADWFVVKKSVEHAMYGLDCLLM